MKEMHKRAMALCLTTALCLGLFSGCGTQQEVKQTQQAVSETETQTGTETAQATDTDVNVEKIDGISDDFIRGMDASEVLSLENSGVTYYDYDGKEQDVFQTLAEKKEALYQFTKDSLNTLLDAGVDVEMVQIGNEINYGLAGEKLQPNILQLLKMVTDRATALSEPMIS